MAMLAETAKKLNSTRRSERHGASASLLSEIWSGPARRSLHAHRACQRPVAGMQEARQ